MRRSILNHFDDVNRNLHAAYFPDIPFDLLFGLSTSDRNDTQEHLPKSLEKQQLEFLDHWVKKWTGSKKHQILFNIEGKYDSECQETPDQIKVGLENERNKC